MRKREGENVLPEECHIGVIYAKIVRIPPSDDIAALTFFQSSPHS